MGELEGLLFASALFPHLSEILVKVSEGVDERVAKIAVERIPQRLKIANEAFGHSRWVQNNHIEKHVQAL